MNREMLGKVADQLLARMTKISLVLFILFGAAGTTAIVLQLQKQGLQTQVAELKEQVREQQSTIKGIIPAAIEWTAQPCSPVDKVDLGVMGFAIGGSHLPNMRPEHLRHVQKSESPGLDTTYYYVAGANSTPSSLLIARKPECKEHPRVSKLEPLKIEDLGNATYKVTCPSGLCDWAPYSELTRRVASSTRGWKIVESDPALFGNNLDGESWSFTMTLVPKYWL